ncbi:hypothetical protein D3C78_1310310 [compost metagenome]
MPRTTRPIGLMLATPFITVSAAVAAAVARRSTVKPAAAPIMPLISHGLAPASSVTLPMIGPTVAMNSLNGGSSTLPTVMPNRVTRFCRSCMAFCVVAARAVYSACIDPAYSLSSPTDLKFFCSVFKLVSSGAMAPTDSLPNRLVSTAACLLFSTLASVCSTRLIVPSLSVCMPLEISFASRRNDL